MKKNEKEVTQDDVMEQEPVTEPEASPEVAQTPEMPVETPPETEMEAEESAEEMPEAEENAGEETAITDTGEPVDSEVMDLEKQDASLMPEEIRNSLASMIKRFYPEAKTETDQELVMAAFPLLEGLVAWHDVWNSLVQDDPQAADFILDVTKNGYSFPEAIALNFSPDELIPPEGTPEANRVAKAHETRQQRISDRENTLAKIGSNRELTAKNLMSIQEKLGLDDETTQNIGKLLGEILVDATSDGIVSEDNWMKLANGLRYEAAMKEKDAEAEQMYEDGKVAGRNEKIEKKRSGKEAGTGLPNLSNSGAGQQSKGKKAVVPLRKEFRV